MAAPKKRSRATPAIVDFDRSLRSALVHLPVALYGPLLERGVPPQTIVVELARAEHGSADHHAREGRHAIDKIYVGWSGMSAAPLSASVATAISSSSSSLSSSQQASVSSVICISPALATTFTPALEAGEHVRVTLLRAPPLPTASRINVVPLSPDDWEVLSLNADEIENNMLGQVRAARTGMTIAVHVGRQGRTVCRFRVESCTPQTQDYASNGDVEGLARAVRLSTDTEVVIAPRTRAQEASAADALAAETKDLGGERPARYSASKAASGSRASANSLQTPATAQDYLRHSPFRVLPISFQRLDRARRSDVVLREEDAQVLALAFAGQIRSEGRCSITKTPCPAAPDLYASSAVLTSIDGSTSKRLNFKSKGRDTGAEQEQVDDDQRNGKEEEGASQVPTRATTSASFGTCPISSIDAFPPRHVWLPDDIRKKLNLRDYDLIRFSSPAPSGMGISRPSSPQLAAKAGEDEDEERVEKSKTLPGFTDILGRCQTLVEDAFRSRAWAAMESTMQLGRAGSSSRAAALRPQTTSAILLTGASGSGKTSLVQAIRANLSPQFIADMTFDCASLTDERLSALRETFNHWLAVAAWHSPTLLVLENLDRIAPADQEHVDSPRSVQVAEALMHRIRAITSRFPIFVIATAQSTTSLNKVCTSAYRVFGEIVEIKAPTKDARRDILAELVHQRKSLVSHNLDHGVIAGQTEGYLPVDLNDLVERAVHQSAIRAAERFVSSDGAADEDGDGPKGHERDDDAIGEAEGAPNSITMGDFTEAQKGFTPLSLRDIQLTRSATKWSDIGGLQETRRVLRETLEWPTRYAKIFAQSPLRLRSGLLLYGFPGCGKTLLAGAVAAECGLNFISVKGPEILQKYIGASEKSVRDLFDRAQAAKPCVLFFDEFDSIAPKRGHDSTGVTDRVVNQLLTQMDGAEGLSGVYVLAATSRPDLIDSALLRPGRLDKSLLCDLPDEADRLDILQAVCKSNKIHLAADVDLEAWAKRTDGFSGADLQALVYNANLEAIHESMNVKSQEAVEQVNGKNSQTTGGSVSFIHVKAQNGHGENNATQSGAERQAVQRKLDLIIQNAKEEARNKHEQRQRRQGNNGADPSDINGGVQKKTITSHVVTEAQLQKCLRTTRQSVPKDEQVRLRRIYKQFVGERSGEFPDGEASRDVGARQSLM